MAKIATKKVKEWQKKLQHGDQKQIAETTGLSIGTVLNAMKHGHGSIKTVELIDTYYNGK